MYILIEYVMYVAFVLVVGASLFVAAALVLFANEILATINAAAWLGTMTPFRWARLAVRS